FHRASISCSIAGRLACAGTAGMGPPGLRSVKSRGANSAIRVSSSISYEAPPEGRASAQAPPAVPPSLTERRHQGAFGPLEFDSLPVLLSRPAVQQAAVLPAAPG